MIAEDRRLPACQQLSGSRSVLSAGFPPLLRRPLKREDVKRKLIAHKNCIHEIGQDMPEIFDRKRHLPEKIYTFLIKNQAET